MKSWKRKAALSSEAFEEIIKDGSNNRYKNEKPKIEWAKVFVTTI